MDKDIFCLKDKIIIITGGLGQLGRQFALALGQQKAKIAIWDKKVENSYIKERFGNFATHDNLMFVPVDVTQKNEIISALEKVEKKWGPPHGLINNAALDSPPNAPAEENGPFETYPEKSWDNVMDSNVKSVFLCCRAIGEKMAAVKKGSIVNICSTYGIVSPNQNIYKYRSKNGKPPFYKPVAYSVSKSALLNLTRYLATYWAARNVRVNTLTPAGVFNNQDETFLKNYCQQVPMGRMANEDEYNGAIQFLLSDASSYMTGSNLVIDGGYTAW